MVGRDFNQEKGMETKIKFCAVPMTSHCLQTEELLATLIHCRVPIF